MVFGRFACDPQGVLAAIHRFALVDIELFLDSRLRIPHIGVSHELRIAAFTDSKYRNVPDSFYDPKSAFSHNRSLAYLK